MLPIISLSVSPYSLASIPSHFVTPPCFYPFLLVHVSISALFLSGFPLQAHKCEQPFEGKHVFVGVGVFLVVFH